MSKSMLEWHGDKLIKKCWIPAPSSVYADVRKLESDSINGVYIFPWEDVAWHITIDEQGRRVTGYTIIERKGFEHDPYNV
jgi:hypothetical protein